VTNWVKSVHEGDGRAKIHIKHNILTSGILRNPATPFPLEMPNKTAFTVIWTVFNNS